AARNRSVNLTPPVGGSRMRRRCRCGPMRRRPLFPPPQDPHTGKRQRNKGRAGHHLLTVNDWVCVERTCWHFPSRGSSTPSDAFLDAAQATVSLGARELACRLNQTARSFDK